MNETRTLQTLRRQWVPLSQITRFVQSMPKVPCSPWEFYISYHCTNFLCVHSHSCQLLHIGQSLAQLIIVDTRLLGNYSVMSQWITWILVLHIQFYRNALFNRYKAPFLHLCQGIIIQSCPWCNENSIRMFIYHRI